MRLNHRLEFPNTDPLPAEEDLFHRYWTSFLHRSTFDICETRMEIHKLTEVPPGQVSLLFDIGSLADELTPSLGPRVMAYESFTHRALVEDTFRNRLINMWDRYTRLLDGGKGYASLERLERRLANQCDRHRNDMRRILYVAQHTGIHQDASLGYALADLETTLRLLAPRFAVLHVVLEMFAVYGLVRPWKKWPSDDPVHEATAFHLQLRLIREVLLDPDVFPILRFNSDLYRSAAERGNLKYENDAADTIGRNMKNNFSRFYHKAPPGSPQEWKAFFDDEFVHLPR